MATDRERLVQLRQPMALRRAEIMADELNQLGLEMPIGTLRAFLQLRQSLAGLVQQLREGGAA